MPRFFRHPLPILLLVLTLLPALTACSPKYNWREVRSKDGGFVVLLPDKPASMSRPVNLNGQTVTMTMTATEVDGVSFAVGYAQLPDEKLTAAALDAMKVALVNNIHGKLKSEQAPQPNSIDIEAVGSRGPGGEPLLLLGHFVARDKRIYQAIVVGNEKEVVREQVTIFLSSFALN